MLFIMVDSNASIHATIVLHSRAIPGYRYMIQRRRWKWLLYEHAKVTAFHTVQAIFRGWYCVTVKRDRNEASLLALSPALPFSIWDRFCDLYIDRGLIPREQVKRGGKRSNQKCHMDR